MKYINGYDKLIHYALRILSKKRYTRVEMGKKLTAYSDKNVNISDDDVQTVIDRVEELGYIDDERFVRDYVAERSRIRPKGKILLRRELLIKGIDKSVLDGVLEGLIIDENKMAFEVLFGRVVRWKKFSFFKQKQKAYQFLYSRGFDRDAIYKAIDRCYNHA